jgi:DNA-binding response OmpR family regulator
LHEHRGSVVSRKNIIHSVWGVHANVRSRSFDQYIVKIRDHFSSNGMDLSMLRTVHGVGYVYDPDGTTARTGDGKSSE